MADQKRQQTIEDQAAAAQVHVDQEPDQAQAAETQDRPPGMDELNFFIKYWRCGAPVVRMGGKRPCLRRAGWGTDHIGTGRCRGHEGKGLNTGVIFQAGNQAARKHGLYSEVLKDEELRIYEELNATGEKALDLQPEINMQKAKIIMYLKNRAGKRVWTEEMETVEPVEIEEGRYVKREHFKKYKGFYIRGDVDDPVLMRALDTLARLVKQQAIIKGDNVPDALDAVNQELRAAEKTLSATSWGQVNAQPVTAEDAQKREGL